MLAQNCQSDDQGDKIASTTSKVVRRRVQVERERGLNFALKRDELKVHERSFENRTYFDYNTSESVIHETTFQQKESKMGRILKGGKDLE